MRSISKLPSTLYYSLTTILPTVLISSITMLVCWYLNGPSFIDVFKNISTFSITISITFLACLISGYLSYKMKNKSVSSLTSLPSETSRTTIALVTVPLTSSAQASSFTSVVLEPPSTSSLRAPPSTPVVPDSSLIAYSVAPPIHFLSDQIMNQPWHRPLKRQYFGDNIPVLIRKFTFNSSEITLMISSQLVDSFSIYVSDKETNPLFLDHYDGNRTETISIIDFRTKLQYCVQNAFEKKISTLLIESYSDGGVSGYSIENTIIVTEIYSDGKILRLIGNNENYLIPYPHLTRQQVEVAVLSMVSQSHDFLPSVVFYAENPGVIIVKGKMQNGSKTCYIGSFEKPLKKCKEYSESARMGWEGQIIDVIDEFNVKHKIEIQDESRSSSPCIINMNPALNFLFTSLYADLKSSMNVPLNSLIPQLQQYILDYIWWPKPKEI